MKTKRNGLRKQSHPKIVSEEPLKIETGFTSDSIKKWMVLFFDGMADENSVQ